MSSNEYYKAKKEIENFIADTIIKYGLKGEEMDDLRLQHIWRPDDEVCNYLQENFTYCLKKIMELSENKISSFDDLITFIDENKADVLEIFDDFEDIVSVYNWDIEKRMLGRTEDILDKLNELGIDLGKVETPILAIRDAEILLIQDAFFDFDKERLGYALMNEKDTIEQNIENILSKGKGEI